MKKTIVLIICSLAVLGAQARLPLFKPKTVPIVQPTAENAWTADTTDLIDSLEVAAAWTPLPDSLELVPELAIETDSSVLLNDPELNPYDYIDTNIDSLYYEWLCHGLLGPDTTCIERDDEDDPIPDIIYRDRVANLPNIIPATYNQIVRRFIELYIYQRRQQVSNMLAMGEYYFPIFEQALEENGLPLELKYLPVIESGLNPNAVSRAGAAGLWQFIFSTGKVYGLQINSLTDERRDPVKSTRAAMLYLKALYDMFGDWNLAIAAYNCGPGNVRKAIARSGGSRDFWKIYYHLPRETRSYVPLFIAANYAMYYHEAHGICPAQLNYRLVADTFMIHQNMHFQQISDVCHVPIESLKQLNPHFRNNIAHGTPDKPGILYLPAEYTPTFITYQDSIANYKRQELLTANLSKAPAKVGNRAEGEAIVYRVRSGDNLYNIARKYHVTVKQLKTWNNLKSDMLRVGQRLIIY
ncbi:MAG: transglycosylase SLT domain-containing protein [Bacteroidales bacterium]|nr:transglycosylase SLT domain-containing protein [Bacteroidales bacterium]